jgi:hypothetical protein
LLVCREKEKKVKESLAGLLAWALFSIGRGFWHGPSVHSLTHRRYLSLSPSLSISLPSHSYHNNSGRVSLFESHLLSRVALIFYSLSFSFYFPFNAGKDQKERETHPHASPTQHLSLA